MLTCNNFKMVLSCCLNGILIKKITHVDLMVIQRSCSSLRVSVNLASPALAPAIIPALQTSESVRVDLPWSTWAMTDMLRIFFFLSMRSRISATVKLTFKFKFFLINYWFIIELVEFFNKFLRPMKLIVLYPLFVRELVKKPTI